jgi:hypothetical protein
MSIAEQRRIAETQHLWCVGTREDGEPCGARAQRGSRYCFWHVAT